LKNSS